MKTFIDPPPKINVFLRLGIWISRRVTGREIIIAKLLAWYPKAALGSALLESLVAHHDKTISDRLLKLLRMQASFSSACPFCIDMNAFEYEKQGITKEEFFALKNDADLAAVESFTQKEKLALAYARLISQTPLVFPVEFIQTVKESFTEREIVIMASTAAQVNYWARLHSALGVPPAGFTDLCRTDDANSEIR